MPEPADDSVPDQPTQFERTLPVAPASAARAPALPSGSVIAERCIVQDAVAEGGMGAVYRVFDKHLGRVNRSRTGLEAGDRVHRLPVNGWWKPSRRSWLPAFLIPLRLLFAPHSCAMPVR